MKMNDTFAELLQGGYKLDVFLDSEKGARIIIERNGESIVKIIRKADLEFLDGQLIIVDNIRRMLYEFKETRL